MKRIINQTGSWTFDDAVAARFEREARTHIPNYEIVVSKCVEIAQKNFPDKNKTKIIDVGSATGYTLEKLKNAGYAEVFGVDNSASMLEKSRVKENLILSDTFPKAHGPFDLVLANWTLHFVKEREEYLRDIRNSLQAGGVLVLSDKMDSGGFVHDRYHDFKRSNGISEEEIRRKSEAVQGILVPYPLEWYLGMLKKIGFTRVEVIDASWCFKTLLCFL